MKKIIKWIKTRVDTIYFELDDDPNSWNLKYNTIRNEYTLLDSNNDFYIKNFNDLTKFNEDELFQMSLYVDYDLYLILSIQQYCNENDFRDDIVGSLEI